MSGVGWDILATVAVGISVAALVYALKHGLRRRVSLPRWAMPAAVGIAMIVFATWNEYAWASRVKQALPARVEVIAEGQARSVLRPWTLLAAPTTRLAMIDPGAVSRDGPAYVVPIMLVERWRKTVTVEQGVDCLTRRIRPPGGAWQPVPAAEPSFDAICRRL